VIDIPSHNTIEERIAVAEKMKEEMGIDSSVEVLVDNMEDEFNKEFAAWPIRYFIAKDGKLLHKSDNSIDNDLFDQDSIQNFFSGLGFVRVHIPKPVVDRAAMSGPTPIQTQIHAVENQEQGWPTVHQASSSWPAAAPLVFASLRSDISVSANFAIESKEVEIFQLILNPTPYEGALKCQDCDNKIKVPVGLNDKYGKKSLTYFEDKCQTWEINSLSCTLYLTLVWIYIAIRRAKFV